LYRCEFEAVLSRGAQLSRHVQGLTLGVGSDLPHAYVLGPRQQEKAVALVEAAQRRGLIKAFVKEPQFARPDVLDRALGQTLIGALAGQQAQWMKLTMVIFVAQQDFDPRPAAAAGWEEVGQGGVARATGAVEEANGGKALLQELGGGRIEPVIQGLEQGLLKGGLEKNHGGGRITLVHGLAGDGRAQTGGLGAEGLGQGALAEDRRIEKLERGDFTAAFGPAVLDGQLAAKIGTQELIKAFSEAGQHDGLSIAERGGA
jgi:hypothetical protein